MKLEVTYAREGLPERTPTRVRATARPPSVAPPLVEPTVVPEHVDAQAEPEPPRKAKRKPNPERKGRGAPVSMRAAIRGALAVSMDLADARRVEPVPKSSKSD